MTRSLPPRADRTTTTPERRALQDALAWPIALTLLVGSAIVFFLPRIVPPQFLTVAVGAAFALLTITLVVILAALVERWLRRHAHDLAVQAETQVQTVGLAGLPTATGDSALVPLASAYADAGARAALTASERETGELLARLGVDAAESIERVLSQLRVAVREVVATAVASTPGTPSGAHITSADATPHDASADVLGLLDELSECTDALRRVTTAVPAAQDSVDVVQLVRDVLAVARTGDGTGGVRLIVDTDGGMVRIDAGRFRDHLHELLRLAQHASEPSATVTVHVSRIFRTSLEETPVRRTGDSPLTIVPRSSGDALRTWVLRAQPGAEVLSVIVTDAATPLAPEQEQRAFEPFAVARPGDPRGITLATIRRTVVSARGTIWLAGSREGGTAVHMLLPIAVT